MGTRTAAAAAGVLAFCLTACGGGGGGSTATPSPPVASPPPPPPANVAPDVHYTTSSTSPDEGQPFWIDASGSTDADGDALTISLSQVSGPSLGSVPLDGTEPSGEGIFAFRAPEVDQDTVLEFEISVSDGEDTSTGTVAITAMNIVLEPEVAALGDVLASFDGLNVPQGTDFYSLPVGNQEAGVIGIQKAESGAPEVFRFVNDYVSGAFSPLETTVFERSTPEDEVVVRGLYLDLAAFGLNLVVGLDKGGVYVMRIDSVDEPNKLVVADWLNIAETCAIVSIPPALNNQRRDLLLGTKGAGLRVFSSQPFDVEPGESIVDIFDLEPGPVIEPVGDFCFLGAEETHQDGKAYAYDASHQQIRSWSFPPGMDPQILTPIDVELPEDLTLVDVTLDAGYDRAGIVASFLMTDGQHDGQHKLIIYASDFLTDSVRRTEFSWSKGIPSDIERFQYPTTSGPFPYAFAISLETAPYLIIVKQGGDPAYGDSGPTFGPLTYAPAPLWVTGVRHARAPDFAHYSLVLTQAQTGTVTMSEIIPEP